jgi:hypothetical protein
MTALDFQHLTAETTGKWVAATFEHDSARPVDGYAAPQLHTYVVFFNLTQTENGETRPLQPRELYRGSFEYEIDLQDNGEPGVDNMYRIFIPGIPYESGLQKLQGGNVQSR